MLKEGGGSRPFWYGKSDGEFKSIRSTNTAPWRLGWTTSITTSIGTFIPIRSAPLWLNLRSISKL
jgi:hypothetical protein